MKKPRILLLQPSGRDPSPLDQSVGARLAAAKGSLRGQIVLERASFRRGDLKSLQRAVTRRAGKISGVVGTTNVPESTYLGELCERLGLLCLVSNNNPAVWNHRKSVFHIGVPTSSTTRAVANHLLRKVRAKRVYLLHDTTYFQKRVARSTASLLKKGGAVVRSKPGSQKNWLDDVRSWKPEALYLIYSSPALALPLVRKLRRALPETPLLLGRSLLRQAFLKALGPATDGVILLDLFHRCAPRTKEEGLFMRALYKEGIAIPTANHGFGWDAMTLCGRALTAAKVDPLAAIECLESGVLIDGATGLFRFSRKDHNGRARFNPSTFSRLRNGRIEEAIRKDKAYEAAKRRPLTRLEKGFDLRWRPPTTRHELHER